MLRISALNPACHCCLRNQSESDTLARICRIEFSVHRAVRSANRRVARRPRAVLHLREGLHRQDARRGVHLAVRLDEQCEKFRSRRRIGGRALCDGFKSRRRP